MKKTAMMHGIGITHKKQMMPIYRYNPETGTTYYAGTREMIVADDTIRRALKKLLFIVIILATVIFFPEIKTAAGYAGSYVKAGLEYIRPYAVMIRDYIAQHGDEVKLIV